MKSKALAFIVNDSLRPINNKNRKRKTATAQKMRQMCLLFPGQMIYNENQSVKLLNGLFSMFLSASDAEKLVISFHQPSGFSGLFSNNAQVLE